MAKKAEAYKEYREAAMIEMLLETLPKVKIKINISFIYLIIFFHRLPLKLQHPCLKPKRSQWFRRAQAKLEPQNSPEKFSRSSVAFPSLLRDSPTLTSLR
jgi:hypothetical protein